MMDEETEETEVEVLKAKVVSMFEKAQRFLIEKKEAEEASNYMWEVLKRIAEGWYVFHTEPLGEEDKDAVLRWARRYVDPEARTWCYREDGDRMSFIFVFRHASDCAKAKLLFPND